MRLNNLETAEKIAENLRREPYRLFRNDCLTKSWRLRSECDQKGIPARLVWCTLGLTKVRLPVVGEILLPYCTHFWAEVDGQRLETSRPLGSRGILGIIPSQIRPLITLRF